MKGLITLVSTCVALSATGALAEPVKRDIQSITTKGNAFFQGGSRFYIRGVDYQPGGSSQVADPIADTNGCQRDIQEFKKLGINAIRVYTVDNSQNHDDCMNALADANIYLILDVNTPKYSLNRDDPKTSYNDVYLQNIFATIDAFAKYSNTLAFFSGNEVINGANSTGAAPYVKAVTRDMRQYIGSRGYRQIPVGYSAADVSENRVQMADYMNCGTADERSDFFAFNDYSWCDPSSFTQSGWDQKVKNFTGYSIPLFLSEYGCNTNTRTFQEVGALYSTETSSVYSGGLVYEYSQEASGYGLVQINGNQVEELEDFKALQSAYARQSNPSGDGGYNANGQPSQCPPASSDWDVTSDALPAIPSPAEKYMTQGAGQGVGLSGPGSQDAGTESASTATAGSGQVTATGTAGKKNGAGHLSPVEFSAAHVVCGLVVVASMMFGTVLL
ncbi:MAG: beta-glucanosyltransferase [Thelocarpon superellum]|nr:MAG: beta-glucanosyltransferase [Thelocarpon superellum]